LIVRRTTLSRNQAIRRPDNGAYMRDAPTPAEDTAHRLNRIKVLHTVIWAIMAASILAIPWAAWFGQLRWAFGLTLLVVGECLVLAFNRGRCPLTDVAARYTHERADNFDIYLPVWLARHNKSIFGFLFVIGEIVLIWRWIRRPGL
jgi:hypothetical protein